MKYSYGIDTRNWNIGVRVFGVGKGRVYRITLLCLVLVARWSK